MRSHRFHRLRRTRGFNIAVGAVFAVLLTGSAAYAETMYVMDILTITVRSGPGIEYRVIASLQTGDRVSVQEQSGDWSKVAFSEDREGWVLSRYLSKEVPSYMLVEKLTAQSQADKERTDALEKENQKLKNENQSCRSTLTTVEANYNDLKENCQDYVQMKKEHEKVQKSLGEIQAQNKDLVIENTVLKDISKIKWFLTGFGVTAVAWLTGFVLGRLRRKQKSDITFTWK